MRRIKFLAIFSMALGLSLITMNSCDSFGSNSEDELYGIWNIDAITLEVTANGSDIVDVMVDDFAFSQEDAEAQLDSMTMDFKEGFVGTLEFKDDLTYMVTLTDDDPENGTWMLSEDGITLTMIDAEMDTDYLTISKLTSSSLIVNMPIEEEDVDLDGDDDEETTMMIDIEVQLSKN